MAKLIVGLGNPGSEFEGTRHNIGFAILDAVAQARQLSWQHKTKFQALTAEFTEAGEKIILAKPQTFYNNSGEAVRAIRDFYKITNENILVVHDELALPFGTIRTREQGSDAGNNGVKSVTSHLGQDFARVRVGIWQETREQTQDKNYVLAKFTKTEQGKFPEIGKEVAKVISEFIQNKITTTTWRL